MNEPIFLDCEASSLDPKHSYPIEIAWGGPDGDIASHLINPYGYMLDWDDWDPYAQSAHGLSRKFLREQGESPVLVAEVLCEALAGKTVYTDAPEYDGFWVKRLLLGARHEPCAIRFVDVQMLLMKVLPEEYWILNQVGNYSGRHIERLYVDARKSVEASGYPAHRAGNDVAYLRELYHRARHAGGWY